MIKRVAVLGGYLPRQCGIATFTTDLSEALARQYPDLTCFAVPVNDRPAGYAYPPRVWFELTEQSLPSYRRAADYLNISDVDVVSLQHEYGIFGGPAGSHILALLQELHTPLVTTFHTVLQHPNPDQLKMLSLVAQLSDRLVVMGRQAADFLKEVYKVPPEKIDIIPHGIPDVPFMDPSFHKDTFHVEGKSVLLTFGLLSPNKGIENVIQALPAILERHPNLVYIVLGATHPHVRAEHGETYRRSLEDLAQNLGVRDSVIFEDRFVSQDELTQYIGAADIYITPYLNQEQIVSGTLAYSLGAGKAVISTPYWYAQEMLADGRGVLVPFRDPGAISSAVTRLLDNEAERHAMRKRAYLFGREMTWARVADRYMESFTRAQGRRHTHPRPAMQEPGPRRRELPLLNLDHLRRLTDSTGMLQHAVFTVPNYREGYSTDDNARALMASVYLEMIPEVEPVTDKLNSRYLAFLWHAFDSQTGRFRNFFSYDRKWHDDIDPSEDCHGRALLGLGTVVGESSRRGLVDLASQLFEAALPAALEFTSPRAWAFAILGIREYLHHFYGNSAAQHALHVLGGRLYDRFLSASSHDWVWFEEILAYDNATLPHALLAYGDWSARPEITDAALASLDWLTSLQRSEQGYFLPIGSNGFYRRGGDRPRFDQQPIEAHATVSACLKAFHITGDERWRREAGRAFDWFAGYNDLRLALYDATTGGCRDGLHADRANQNEGAESTLAFLLSWLEIYRLEGTPIITENEIQNFARR